MAVDPAPETLVFADERQTRIAELVAVHGRVRLSDLVDRFENRADDPQGFDGAPGARPGQTHPRRRNRRACNGRARAGRARGGE